MIVSGSGRRAVGFRGLRDAEGAVGFGGPAHVGQARVEVLPSAAREPREGDAEGVIVFVEGHAVGGILRVQPAAVAEEPVPLAAASDGGGQGQDR
jgi:hypothetical protein